MANVQEPVPCVALPNIPGWSVRRHVSIQLPHKLVFCLSPVSMDVIADSRVANFTVRSRALASFLTAVVSFAANISTGLVLDLKFPASTKSRAVYLGILILVTGCWIWNAVVEVKLSSLPETPSFDLGDGAFFNSAFAVYVLFKFFYSALQTYLYWLLGAKKGTQENGEVSRMTGIMRTWESIGSAIAYGIGATDVSNEKQMIIALVLWVFTIPFTLAVVLGRWDLAKEGRKDVETTDDSAEENAVRIEVQPKRS